MLSKLTHNALISLAAIAFVLISVIVCFAEKANYIYDRENRLIRVEYATGTTEEYFYDAVGNLLSQNVMYNISVAPTAHNFGTVYVGATSAANTFTVQNSGTANLLIGSITLSGLHPSQFGIRNDNCSGHTVSTNGTCTVQAVFAPTSASAKNANLAIPSSDPDMPNLTVPLSGTALSGNYSISGTVLKANKKPLSGVTMTLSGAATGTTTTNASGNYTFTELFNGTFTVTPQKTGYTFTPASRTISISGGNVTGQNFTGK